MKITQNNIRQIINSTLVITILAIPFYQIRIPIFSTSLSILTCSLVILCAELGILHRKHLVQQFKKHNVFLILALLFVAAFVPALLAFPNIHAYGVFAEWIFLPAVCGALLWIHLSHYSEARITILRTCCTMLLGVSVVALAYFFSDFLTYDGRLHAFFLSPNHLAMFLSPLLFVAGTYYYVEERILIRAAIVTTIFLGTLTIFLTQSLSTMIALCGAAFFCLVFTLKKRCTLVIFSLTMIALVIVFSVVKFNNSNTLFERNSLSSRMMIWETSVHLIQNSPLVGYQLDEFQELYLDAQPLFEQYLEWAVPTPHNLSLNFLVSGGFVAFLIFNILSAYILFHGLNYFYQSKKQHVIFLCAAFLVILFGGIIDTTYWKNDLSIIFWIIAALIASLSPPPEQATG
jgi:O-antigen ligase